MGSMRDAAFRMTLATFLVLGAAGASETFADVWTFRDAQGVSRFSATAKPGWTRIPGLKAPRPVAAKPTPEKIVVQKVAVQKVAIQKVAAHPPVVALWTYKDAEGVSHFSLIPKPGWRSLDPATPAMTKASVGSFDELIHKYANEQSIDAALVKALIRAESGFDPDAKSGRGAHGLMQLTMSTARAHGVANIYDPGQNIRAGVRHLRALLDRFENDSKLALAAYNAGEYAVTRYQGVPPFPETEAYVQKVMRYVNEYRLAERHRST